MDKKNGMEWGSPAIDYGLCTKCGLCAKICPSFTISMEDGRPTVRHKGQFGCLACGQCVSVCSADAVRVTGRRMKKEDAFRLSPEGGRATADTLTALLEARRSMRHYEDRPLPREVIDKLLAMAATAPMGFPPSDVGVVVINGKARVQEFASDICAAMKKWMFLASPAGTIMMKFIMDKTTAGMMKDFVLPLAGEIIKARHEGRDWLFYNAPCVIIFHYPMKDTVDPAIACSYATIAAEALGLGSCIIGTVAPALAGDKKLKGKWGIPDAAYPSLAMIAGYPDVHYTRGVRRSFSSVQYR
ncbi:MAG: nitroreductase family protein [Candidatus Omnitrophica bacterium]|nr:nitroreductase family protein [Candidatus Omnitrophota bacterium]